MSARVALGVRARYAAILAHTGTVAMLTGVVIAAPVLVCLAVPAEWSVAPVYVLPGVVLALLGAVLRRLAPEGAQPTLGVPDASIVVLLSWALAVLFAAIPFMWAGGLDFTEAVFESTSGWTTTGLSVIRAEGARPTILLLRSTLQLAGGAGLAILMLSALLGPPGVGLSRAEGRGEQLAPLISRSAALVVRIYAAYALVGVVLLRLAGMGWFDAVNHSFAAVSTGGFSTRDASVGYWDSPLVEVVIILLMYLGNLSFVTAYKVLRGQWRSFWDSGEVRVFAALGGVGIVVLLVAVTPGLPLAVGKQARVAVFEVATALTTTGFSTVGYGEWPAIGWWVIILLMVVGGGADSTAGGLKQHRVYVLYRYLLFDLKRRLGPRNAANEFFLKDAGIRRFFGPKDVASIAVFVFLYLVVLGVGTGILAWHGFGLGESLFEFSSALGTVGLSIGVTSASAPGAVLWAETAGMLLGRLEFYAVFVAVGALFVDLEAVASSARRVAP